MTRTASRSIAWAATLMAGMAAARADDGKPACPLHEQHAKAADDGRAEEVKRRGGEGMGFDQDRTRHHFRLFADGGAIEVAVADAADGDDRERIRQHLGEIAKAFAAGDFERPMFIHGTTPPGVPAMRRLRARISYRYEELPGGGRVRIATKDRKALAAVHAFLRFQIDDHRTGDPGTVEPST